MSAKFACTGKAECTCTYGHDLRVAFWWQFRYEIGYITMRQQTDRSNKRLVPPRQTWQTAIQARVRITRTVLFTILECKPFKIMLLFCRKSQRKPAYKINSNNSIITFLFFVTVQLNRHSWWRHVIVVSASVARWHSAVKLPAILHRLFSGTENHPRFVKLDIDFSN